MRAFEKVATAFDTFTNADEVGFRSKILNDIVFSLPNLRGPVKSILTTIDVKKAVEDARADLWRDSEKYPEISDAKFVSR